MTDLATATILAALILVASIVSVEFGISVAIVEIGFGVVAASVFGLRPTPWIDFIGSFAWTADLAESHAVLPAFLLGLAVSDVFKRHPEEQRRFRIVSFAFLTPVFFLKGGLNVDG